MLMDNSDLAELSARVSRLEDRLAGFEHQDVSSKADAIRREHRNEIDEEALWALHDQAQRLGAESVVQFTGSVVLETGKHYEWHETFDADAVIETHSTSACDSLAAFGHPVRVLVLRGVLRGLQTVTELTLLAGIGTSGQLYHHLRQLVSAGWLVATHRGRYEVPADRVVPLLVILAAAEQPTAPI
jgi:hypothetical protein